jgi:GAF domain-containing protein
LPPKAWAREPAHCQRNLLWANSFATLRLVASGMAVNVLEVLTDPARIVAAERLLPLDAPRARILDRLVRLAAGLVQAPIAMLTIVEGERQVFAAQTGLPEELARPGSTGLEYSICQHAVSRGRPLIVGDAPSHSLLRDHPAVVDLGVVAYAGIPLVMASGYAVGTLCAVDLVPRDWSDDHLAQLALLADFVTDQFELQCLEREAAFRRAWNGVPEMDWKSPHW